MGPYPITSTLSDGGSGKLANYTVTQTNGTLTITLASTTTTAKVSGSVVRYKDIITLSATIKPLNAASLLTGSVAFTIGSISYGSATVVKIPDSADGSVLATVTSQVNNLPNPSYTVTATFTSTNANYSGSSGTTSLKVDPRNASPYSATGFYTGDVFAWTTGTNSSTATVTLSTTIKDANDPNGDLRAAKVTFYFVNGSTLTPISSAQNLPVGLVNITDGTVGTASAIVQLNIGSSNAQGFQIAVGISGGYTNKPFDAQSSSIVTVAKPIPGGFLGGGGNLLNSNSKGLIAGANLQKTDFEFDVIYNKSLTNPQGKVNLILRSYYQANGTLGTVLRTYLIKSTAISTLAVKLTSPATASFSSKANVQEQLQDGTVVNIDGGAILQIAVTDGSTTGGSDGLAITVQKKSGGLWFSSNWNGAKTVEQWLAAGNLVVR